MNRIERPRIGFVVDWLNDSYQLEVLGGAARAANECGAQLIILPGGVLGAPHSHGARRNGLYQLISTEHFDGLVVMTGTLGNAGGIDVMQRVAPTFPQDRVCHVALPVEGSPSVLIDNRSGMRRMIEHLILVHNRRKIGFIRGPESNPEAEARYQAYIDVLEAFKIPFDERLVAPGNFLREAGVEAVKLFLDERGLRTSEISAIAAADDLMALAAMEELRSRGLRVPSDVAVVGFDDVEEARFAFPPLSTVRQPLYEQGRVAVRTVLERLRAGTSSAASLSATPLLDTACRFRRSCGCTAEDPGALTARPKSDTRMSLRDSVIRRREQIEAELLSDMGSANGDWEFGWQRRIVNALLETIDGREEAFREAFDQVLERIMDLGVDASVGHAVTSALRRQLSVCAGDDPAQIRRVEGLLHDARILTSNAVGRSEAQRRLRLEREAASLSHASVLIGTLDPENWATGLGQALTKVGIRNCVLLRMRVGLEAESIFLQGDDSASPQGRSVVDLAQLEPASFLPRFAAENLLIEPLDDGTKMTGLAILVWDEMKPHLVEVIRELLSGVLRRCK